MSEAIDILGWLLEAERKGDKEARRELYDQACGELAAGRVHTVNLVRLGDDVRLFDPSAGQPVTVTVRDGRLLDWLVCELDRQRRKLPGKPGRPSTMDADLDLASQVARRIKLADMVEKAAIAAVAKSTGRKYATVDRIFRHYRQLAYHFIEREQELRGKNPE